MKFIHSSRSAFQPIMGAAFLTACANCSNENAFEPGLLFLMFSHRPTTKTCNPGRKILASPLPNDHSPIRARVLHQILFLVRNANSRLSVLVIGAGVNGLTTALKLLQHGAQVTILADKFAPQVTSVVAGALWEWPPAVCGSHHHKTSLARSKVWSALSYPVFSSLASNPRTGVFLRPVTFYFKNNLEESPLELSKIAEFCDKVEGFRRDPGLIAKNGVNASLGLKDAYRFIAPMVDTDVYMSWLLEQVRALGCRIVERHLQGSLAENEHRLRENYSADWIVNCSGLGARELACDNVYPLRGALVRLHNNIGLAEAHCVSHQSGDANPSFVFILPRGRDRILVGGLAEENEWDLDLTLDHPSVRQMWSHCLEFLPALKRAKLDETEPVRVGLRPVRPHNVRLEIEPNTRIIHNYGHGGSGVTFSWGCASEIAELVLSSSEIPEVELNQFATSGQLS